MCVCVCLGLAPGQPGIAPPGVQAQMVSAGPGAAAGPGLQRLPFAAGARPIQPVSSRRKVTRFITQPRTVIILQSVQQATVPMARTQRACSLGSCAMGQTDRGVV